MYRIMVPTIHAKAKLDLKYTWYLKQSPSTHSHKYSLQTIYHKDKTMHNHLYKF